MALNRKWFSECYTVFNATWSSFT